MPESLPLFFVPGATPEDQEPVFTELARFAGQPAPPLSERVYSITFSRRRRMEGDRRRDIDWGS